MIKNRSKQNYCKMINLKRHHFCFFGFAQKIFEVQSLKIEKDLKKHVLNILLMYFLRALLHLTISNDAFREFGVQRKKS